MSWFDATGFANLAMTALKEAQKTIDKALDIKDEDQKPIENQKEDTSDFFASWGLKKEEDVPHHDKSKDAKQETTNSIWGSFTGSFFESPKFSEGERNAKGHSKSLQTTPTESDKTKTQKLVSSSSFSEDYKSKKSSPFKTAKRIKDVKEKISDDKIHNVPSQDIAGASTSSASTQLITADTPSNNNEEFEECSISTTEESANVVESCLDEKDAASKCDQDEKSECEKKEITEQNSNSESSASNKLSSLSPGSDKKSLESVEILGSRSNTDCTTTPESEGSSLSNLTSPSTAGTKVNSESVEVLPDSLVTSPSSVEILGDWKSDNSPYISPVEPRNSESSCELERDDLVTPCWEDVNVAQSVSKENQANPSSSDVSPYESPMEEVKTPHNNLDTDTIDSAPSTRTYPEVISYPNKILSTGHATETSSENVELPHDTNEPDEVSLAEDSYTSASESTVVTMLESFQQKEQVKSKIEMPMNVSSSGQMHDLCSDGKQILKRGSTDGSLNLSLDSLSEKHNLHLPIEAITTQPIRKPEYFDGNNKISESDLSSFDRLINATIEPAEPDRYSTDEGTHPFKSDTLDLTDQHLMSTDSSCEGTLIESSSEENPQLMHKSEEKILEVPLSASSYVKTMLADAMIEKGEIIETEAQSADMPRENSPISSERYK